MSDPFVYLAALLLILCGLFAAYGLHRARQAQVADWGAGWLNCVDGINRLFCHVYHRMNAVRIDLPERGPAILVANHLSGLDPLLLVAASDRPLRFVIAREQYRLFGLTWFFRAMKCIPVDRQKRPERAMRGALECLKEGEVVALFPQGRIRRETDPPRPLKGGAVRLAQIAGCPLIPVRIEGVRGQGHVFPSLVLRGRVRLIPLDAIDCAGRSTSDVLDELASVLVGPAGRESSA